jgi:DNA-directed RNA polymerase specialized sigma subunit
MKITIRYNDKLTNLEVPDEDFTLMIDADYEDRLSAAEDKETVARRSPQEIMDERFNKPEYNNWHKFDRNRGMPKKPFRKDAETKDESDHMDYFPDKLDKEAREKKEEYEYYCGIIRTILKPKHSEPFIAVYLDGMSMTDYAKSVGVSKSAISHRLTTAKKNLKRIFPNSSTFPSCHG